MSRPAAAVSLPETRFGGDPGIVGQSVTVGDRPFDVIGILPSGFSFASTSFFAGRPEIVTLLAPVPSGTKGGVFHPIVRLEPGVTHEQAQAQMDVVVAPAREARPELATQTPSLENIRDTIYPVGRDVMRSCSRLRCSSCWSVAPTWRTCCWPGDAASSVTPPYGRPWAQAACVLSDPC